MKFCQLIEYNIFFFKNHEGNEAGRLAPGPSFFKKKSFIKGKNKWSAD